MSEYSLQLNEQTAALLIKALDLYSRIGIGQLETILEHPAVQNVTNFDRKEAEYQVNRLKETLFGFVGGQSHGIHNPDVPDIARQAYDILCVLRHRLAWDKAGNPPKRTPEMFGVHYDEPSHLDTSHPLPLFRRI